MNMWQDHICLITLGSISYGSEASFDNGHWKSEYYGSVYDRLIQTREQYDPDFFIRTQLAR